MSKVGFIGLGIMGRPMAENLVKAGQDVMVSDLNAKVVEELCALGASSGTYAELARSCDLILTILPTGAIVREVLFGENGVASALTPGKVVCDMSSVTPGESQECYARLKTMGVGFVDAPVSGGEPGAIAGTLAIMCGGDQADFDRLVPLFEIMGSSALLIGGSGAGSVTKLANQIIVNLNIAAVSEALVLATKAGVDPMKVYHAIRGGLAGSAVLDAKAPMMCRRDFRAAVSEALVLATKAGVDPMKVYHAIRGGLAGSAVLDAKAPMMCRRDFRPGGTIRVNHKDIKNVLATAHEIDVPLPLTAQLFEVQQALKVSGHMDDDHSGYVQYFEQLAGVVVESREA